MSVTTMPATNTIDLEPTYTEVVTPSEYVRIFKEDRDRIESARVVPPRLGDDNFGVIVIKRKTPLYAPKHMKPERR